MFETREHFGPRWRLSYAQHGELLIVMRGGGDKCIPQANIWRAIALAKSPGGWSVTKRMTVSERSEFDALGSRNREAEVAAYLTTVLEENGPACSGPAKECEDRL